jgi:hypothetical protein
MKPPCPISFILALEWAAAGLWLFVALFNFGPKRHNSRWLHNALWFPGLLLKFILIFVTLGFFLSACSSQDPLPVAHGPLFQLNATNWQATSQDLDAPPKIEAN